MMHENDSCNDILRALKHSKKGQLQYDDKWYKDGSFQELLAECTSPPAISVKPVRSAVQHKALECIADKPSAPEKELVDKHLEISARALTTEKELLIQEKYINMLAKERLRVRQKQFTENTQHLLQQAESQLYELYFKLDNEAEMLLERVQQQEQARDAEVKKKQLRLREHHKQHARVLDEKLQEARQKQKDEEDIKQRKQAEKNKQLHELAQMLRDVKQLHDKSQEMLLSCQYLQHISDGTKKSPQLISQVYDRIRTEIMVAQSSEEVKQGSVQIAIRATEQANKIHQFLSKQLADANKKGKEEADQVEKAKNELKKKQEEAKNTAVNTAPPKSSVVASSSTGL